MGERTITLAPRAEKVLAELGENIKLARLRRKLSTTQICERAGISRNTLWQIEKGSSTVAMGYYVQVLFVLGMENDLRGVGRDDALGYKIQDSELLMVRERAPKYGKPKE